MLDVADHREARAEPAQDGRVRAGQGGADAVGAEVHGHPGEANVGRMLETQRERVPGNDGGELDTALAFLNFQRACVFKKIDGLEEEQLRRRLVVSDTTLLGLVKHFADGERWWFAHHLGGDPAYADIDWSMVVPESVSAAEVIADYRAAIAEADRYIAAADGPETMTALPVGDDGPRTLRWVLAHKIAEIARHLGHMDILREQIDETTGR
ncbi:DinB family protein [Nocardioides caricicola]